MNYTLHQLQVFLKIAEHGSITKAAEELHLSQPAVSIQLKNFQIQFEIPLTEVVGRKLYVTEFGKEIAVAANKILEQVQAINLKTLAYKGQLTGRLKIAVVSTGKYVMPYFLTNFLQQHPGIELRLDVTNRAMVINNINENDIDFALVSILPDALQVESVELMENKLYLIAGKDYPIPKGKLDNKIFEEVTLIYREAGSGTRLTMERFLRNNNIPVSKKLELTSNEAVKQAVLAGLGCSIMPIIGIKNELKSGELRILPVPKLPITTNWNLIYLKSKRFSPAAEAFLKHLNEEKEAIIRKHFDWVQDKIS
jgi:LysR family transcriptional regulator, low CO2-responsive transcriptional regulator